MRSELHVEPSPRRNCCCQYRAQIIISLVLSVPDPLSGHPLCVTMEAPAVHTEHTLGFLHHISQYCLTTSFPRYVNGLKLHIHHGKSSRMPTCCVQSFRLLLFLQSCLYMLSRLRIQCAKCHCAHTSKVPTYIFLNSIYQ